MRTLSCSLVIERLSPPLDSVVDASPSCALSVTRQSSWGLYTLHQSPHMFIRIRVHGSNFMDSH